MADQKMILTKDGLKKLQDELENLISVRRIEVAERIKPILLRRRKADVALQLPSRIDKNLFVPMTTEQLDAHHSLKQQAARLVAKWHRQHFLSEIDRKQLLLTLSQMRMTCDSLYVLDEHSRYDTKVEEVMNILDECGVTENGMFSTDEERSTVKVVIFSQWERMTRLVAQELEQSGVEFVYLHGNVPARERQERVEAFATDPAVRVFLSTDAGSVGLNLQSASVVINVDVPWNPAVLEQRIGRIHRIGQQRGVEVINLISAGTIEEDMLSKLRFKASLFEGVLDSGEDAVFLGNDNFDSLLSGLQDYMEEGGVEPLLGIAVSEEEQHREAVQTELSFDEPAAVAANAAATTETTNAASPDADVAALMRLLSRLLQADEPTRQRVVAMLERLAGEV